QYYDAIVACPTGFAPLLNEMYVRGLSRYIEWDDTNTIPTGIGGGLHRFYPAVPTFDTPGLAYIRAYQDVIEQLADIPWESIQIFAVCPAGDGIYAIIEADQELLAVYEQYAGVEPELVEVEGEMVTNPNYGQLKKIGVWA
ncbi:MAG: hypothetical protein ACOY4W_04750, partial [Thermodesulfobacteriota bacterium]